MLAISTVYAKVRVSPPNIICPLRLLTTWYMLVCGARANPPPVVLGCILGRTYTGSLNPVSSAHLAAYLSASCTALPIPPKVYTTSSVGLLTTSQVPLNSWSPLAVCDCCGTDGVCNLAVTS